MPYAKDPFPGHPALPDAGNDRPRPCGMWSGRNAGWHGCGFAEGGKYRICFHERPALQLIVHPSLKAHFSAAIIRSKGRDSDYIRPVFRRPAGTNNPCGLQVGITSSLQDLIGRMPLDNLFLQGHTSQLGFISCIFRGLLSLFQHIFWGIFILSFVCILQEEKPMKFHAI